MTQAVHDYKRPPPRPGVSAKESPLALGLSKVRATAGWWYRLEGGENSGGIWRTSYGRLNRVLPWCPEVLSQLTALDDDSQLCEQYFTVRLRGRVATLSAADLTQGKGWEQFPAIDLWECLPLSRVLASVVHCQASGLNPVCFREDRR